MRELTTWQKVSQRYLAWLLVRADWWQKGIESILPEMLTGRDEVELYSQFIVYYTNNTSNWSQDSLLEEQLDQSLTLSDTQNNLLKALRILSDDLHTLDDDRKAENDWEQLLRNLQKIFNRQRLQELQNKLNISEQEGNIDLSKQLSTEINQLFARMTKLQ